MKHLKSFEKLGVPQNITETSEQIYNLLIQKLKSQNKKIWKKTNYMHKDIVQNTY
jgi:hypothetical protein